MDACLLKICHPNRDSARAKATKLLTILLLLASAILACALLIVTWNQLSGMRFLQGISVALYLLLAILVAQWRCGALPLAAALGTVMGIIALVAAPGWFSLERAGFSEPSIGSEAVGSLTLLFAALQLALIVVSLYGFRQRWNVEVEVPVEEPSDATGPYLTPAAV